MIFSHAFFLNLRSISIAFTERCRCSPLFWAYGYITHTSTTLYPYSSFPSPVQDSDKKRKYIAVLSSRYLLTSKSDAAFYTIFYFRNGDVPCALVRNLYTKSWSTFDRLVAIVPMLHNDVKRASCMFFSVLFFIH